MNTDLYQLVRKNILSLKPYASARDEFKGVASVFLDANENAYGSPLGHDFNRYPDPVQNDLKSAVAKIKGVPVQNIFIGNGSDEVIDLAIRIFCEPGEDEIIICPPTYGMYQVSAHINNVGIRKVPLLPNFGLDVAGILNAVKPGTKIIFICSPNNPTGNNMAQQDVIELAERFSGLIVIDEAYINYSRQPSFISSLTRFANLLVMQTLSKAWGLAGLRIGLAFGSEDLLALFNKVKPPYNIGIASQQLAIDALKNAAQVNGWIRDTVKERERVIAALLQLPCILEVYPSDANFILVKTDGADALYNYLTEKKIVVRNRSREFMCEDCLRITVGTPVENILLLEALIDYRK